MGKNLSGMERSVQEDEIEMMKIVKTRNVMAKLVDENEPPIVLDDKEVKDMVEELMSDDFIDSKGKGRKSKSIRCGNTIVEILDNHFEKFSEAMKNISPQKLQELKDQIRYTVQEDPLLADSLDDIGIDLNNFENYLGSVEVLTIGRIGVYNVYEIKNEVHEEKRKDDI